MENYTQLDRVLKENNAAASPQPSPQAMNRAAKWRGKQNVLTGTIKN
jgi:hypothetical protein